MNAYDFKTPQEIEAMRENRELAAQRLLQEIANTCDDIKRYSSAAALAVGVYCMLVAVNHINDRRDLMTMRSAHAPAIAAADTNRDGKTSVDEIVGIYQDIGLHVAEERPGVYTFNGKPIIDNGVLQIDQPALDSYVVRRANTKQ